MTEQTPEGTTPKDTTEGQTAPQEGQTAPQGDDTTTPDPEATDGENGPENGGDGAEGTKTAGPSLREQHDAAQEAGVLGALAPNEGPDAIKTADQAAPDGFSEDRQDAVVGDLEDHRLNVAKAVPLQETKTSPVKGEAYRQGFAGTLPNADGREDLTLAGVTARDYPDADEGDTGQPVQES